ncbi:D-Ala-D-Ala carboxypeptidase. Metallo peptidase. MEROPS family M15B [Cryobacterium psychrotolerans]|uniref:D-Ala-D-Ala carboxypeptidase. Metallo peptidase. MEROPS family M15B n=1 Tax=Cryobacterium psychrotolerans TaxID=386301 RepID=A0A1G9CZY9_9MICO|nr:D-Ala-D-Ala carboxypeptidase. Metallo peptidase. MEROPS family M15B [Cryobacterium psychrotolerans]
MQLTGAGRSAFADAGGAGCRRAAEGRLDLVPDQRLPGSSPGGRWRVRRAAVLVPVAVVLAAGALIAGVLSASAPASRNSPAPSPAAAEPARPAPSAAPTAVPTFDRGARSTDDPASLWVVVNKKRPLTPPDFAPTDLADVPVPHVYEPKLRQEASVAAVAMFAGITEATGLSLQSQSAYRGFEAQTRVYDRAVRANGQASADAAIARPGSSEHQTGLALDISSVPSRCALSACFADTPHGRWLAANAWRYGFLLRYPADKVAITGYEFEPWHFRYIGVQLAGEMHRTRVSTLEEFFGLPAAPDYD